MDREYSRLLSEIEKRDIKHKAIQKALGLEASTLSVKMHGQKERKLFARASYNDTRQVFSRIFRLKNYSKDSRKGDICERN